MLQRTARRGCRGASAMADHAEAALYETVRQLVGAIRQGLRQLEDDPDPAFAATVARDLDILSTAITRIADQGARSEQPDTDQTRPRPRDPDALDRARPTLAALAGAVRCPRCGGVRKL